MGSVIEKSSTMDRASVRNEHYLELLKDLRLMDDDFFSEALDEKIEPVEYILCTILEREDIKVQHTEAQVEYKSATKRSIKLDIRAVDADGHVMDIEVQRADKGASVRRARFHSSVIDRTLLEKGEDFDALVDTYVIFITERDRYGAGLPLYHVERTVTELKNKMFGDGAHIIYVNGNYKGNDAIGQLISDFHQTDPENMHYDALAQGVKHFKEVEGGHEKMSEIVEEYAEKEKIVSIQNLMKNMKLTLEQALNVLEIQGDEWAVITKQLQK